MPGLTYTLKADATGIEKGLRTAKQKVAQFQNDVSAMDAKAAKRREIETAKASRLNSLKFGMGAMQVQDIAVGIQGGQKAATIVMQQGTQLLSMFGPQGAIAGAVLGIGTLLVTSLMKGTDEIKKMDEASKGLFRNISENSAQRDIEGLAKNMEEAAIKIAEIRTQLAPKQGRVFHTQSSINEMNEMGRQIDDLKASQVSAEKRILEIATENMKVARLRADGEEDAADALETQLKLKREMERIDALKLSPKNTAILKQQAEERITIAQRVKENKERADLEKEQQAEEEKIAKEGLERMQEEQNERTRIAQKQADDEARIREQGANEFTAAEKKKKDAIESRFTLDQKLELAKERVREAQKAALAARGTVGMEAAEAKLAEAQGGLMDVREEQIQRIMGGSTSAAAAARADRREQRARARAQRILQKRQDIRDMDAKARGEWAKPAEMNLVPAAGKDPVENAVNEGNKVLNKLEQELVKLNQRLTVA